MPFFVGYGKANNAFVNGKTGERYQGSRTDIEFLIELMQMRLKWLKDDEEPNTAGGQPSAVKEGGNQPVGHEGVTPEPPSSPIL